MKTAFNLSHEIPQRTSTEHDYEFRARAEKWLESVVQLDAAKSALESAVFIADEPVHVAADLPDRDKTKDEIVEQIEALRNDPNLLEQLEK